MVAGGRQTERERERENCAEENCHHFFFLLLELSRLYSGCLLFLPLESSSLEMMLGVAALETSTTLVHQVAPPSLRGIPCQ